MTLAVCAVTAALARNQTDTQTPPPASPDDQGHRAKYENAPVLGRASIEQAHVALLMAGLEEARQDGCRAHPRHRPIALCRVRHRSRGSLCSPNRRYWFRSDRTQDRQARQAELIRRLELRVAELERRLGMDGGNSSTPPSKEPLRAKARGKAARRSHGRGSSKGLPVGLPFLFPGRNVHHAGAYGPCSRTRP
jgi:hypothetical protein